MNKQIEYLIKDHKEAYNKVVELERILDEYSNNIPKKEFSLMVIQLEALKMYLEALTKQLLCYNVIYEDGKYIEHNIKVYAF